MHATHREAQDRAEVLDAEMLVNQPVLRHHHVADGEPVEYVAAARRAVGWGGGESIGQRVDHDDEQLGGVKDRILAEEWHPILRAAQEPGRDQHGVVPSRAEPPERAIG